jgi:RNA polymerase sigma-70 factor (ECF subfamily)
MADVSPNPAQWLAAARAGSQEALGQTLEGCRRYLLLVADQELDPQLRAKAGASDLVQQTFLEAQRDFDHFHGSSEAELLAWLRRLLQHNLADFTRRYRATAKRRASREVTLDAESSCDSRVDGLAADTPTASGHVMAQEETEALHRALERLPDDYRLVLLLRYQEERSFEEIGRQMQRSPNAARKLWLRAVERLQQQLDASP